MIHYDPASCSLCPRNCRADRAGGKTGFCQETDVIRVGRAALHYWEEPCISGTSGSGTVFFAGCALRCVYCQNHELIRDEAGLPVSAQRLQEIFFELKEKGAVNINLVTPDHFIPQILPAVRAAQNAGLGLPFVWNLSGYETREQVQALEGAAAIYLADYKYADARLAARYSHAPDYPETAMAALAEMVRQRPEPRFDPNGIMQEGVIVRHLLLPSHVNASKEALRQLQTAFGNHIYISILNQYTPAPGSAPVFRNWHAVLQSGNMSGLSTMHFPWGSSRLSFRKATPHQKALSPPLTEKAFGKAGIRDSIVIFCVLQYHCKKQFRHQIVFRLMTSGKERRTTMKTTKKWLAMILAAVMMLCMTVPAAAEETTATETASEAANTYTSSDGVLSIELPNESWKEITDPTHWIVLSDGANMVTINHFSNGESFRKQPLQTIIM